MRQAAPLFTHHNGQGHVRHFNKDNNEDEMERFFMQVAVTLIGLLLVGIAAIITYNSCLRVRKAVQAGSSYEMGGPSSTYDVSHDGSQGAETFPRKGKDLEMGGGPLR